MLKRFAVPLGCILLAAGCRNSSTELVLSGPTMGTTYTVKVVGMPGGLDGSRVRMTIEEVLAGIDRSMSGYRSDSEIALFNAARSTQWFEVSPDVAKVVAAALEVSASSAGAFDVTVAPLVAAWGFGPAGQMQALPDSGRLAAISRSVGFRKLQARANPPALRKDSESLAVDLNGIAPGFAVDRLAERFLGMHIESFMIDIGGEIRAHGRNAQGEVWRVAIERPLDAKPAPYAIVQLDGAAVATSGEYRHYYVRDGRRYSHTIDPRTARPVDHELGSVVVIGSAATRSDAWATALNVLGSKQGFELAQRHGIAAMFIERRAGEWRSRATREFARYLVHGPPSQSE